MQFRVVSFLSLQLATCFVQYKGILCVCFFSEPFDLQQLYFRATMDGISRITFGEDVNSLNGDGDGEASFATAFDAATSHMVWRAVNPFWKFQRCARSTETWCSLDVFERDGSRMPVPMSIGVCLYCYAFWLVQNSEPFSRCGLIAEK